MYSDEPTANAVQLDRHRASQRERPRLPKLWLVLTEVVRSRTSGTDKGLQVSRCGTSMTDTEETMNSEPFTGSASARLKAGLARPAQYDTAAAAAATAAATAAASEE